MELLQICSLDSLKNRRNTAYIIFLFKSLHSQIDYADILGLVNINVPKAALGDTYTFYLSSP